MISIDQTEVKKDSKNEYMKQWRAQNKEKVNNYSLKGYIKKINENPDYRNILKERTKQRYLKLTLEKGEQPKPRGRPRTKPIKEAQEKLKIGRPRKYE